MIERTLVLLKPDAVARQLSGEVIRRIENTGMKIIALKMMHATKDIAYKHYREDIAQRYGAEIRDRIAGFIMSGPVIAMIIEGVGAIDNVRRLAGSTEPAKAAPGTIRGDLCHVSYKQTDARKIAVKNIIHASATPEEAKIEIDIWFQKNEIFEYKTAHEEHTHY